MLLLVSMGVGGWGFLLRFFGVCNGGTVGLVRCRCRCRYCRLRCSILVAVRHGQVMCCSFFKVLVCHVCLCVSRVCCYGGTSGVYVRHS
jgi:hypothetical protein